MSNIKKIKQAAVFAPASIGNTSISFDLVGTALSSIDQEYLGDIVVSRFSSENKIENVDKFAHLIKNDKSNLVYKGLQLFNSTLSSMDIPIKTVHLTLHKRLPIGTGLGSSACSTVATIESLNRLYGYPFSKHQALAMMSQLEGEISGSIHYDNIAPAYLGGMLIIDKNNPLTQIGLPYNKEWIFVLCYNGEKISTFQAREILPKQYDKQIAIENALNLGAFIHYLYSKNYDKAMQYMKEVIAEPYRKHLIKDFTLAQQQCYTLGGVNFGISGSGPCIFSIFNDIDKARTFKDWLQSNFICNELGFSSICKISEHGSTVLKEMEEYI